jgi:copper chaperone
MTRLSIPDMSCGHCRASITAALTPLPGVSSLTFDAENRAATVFGTANTADLIAALSRIGFTAAAQP